tara:strand:- start:906 stop:2057 length:1152 start_codon:yes stop_codon:yes gene_type:complete
MKKILFVTTRCPYSKHFSGDRLRSSEILKFLSKKNRVDLIYSDVKKNNITTKIKHKGKVIFFPRNFFLSIFNTIKSVFKLEPLQNGFFFSNDVKKYIEVNKHKYEVIICHLIRSAQYLPKDFKGQKILEMTDLYSENYNQTIKKMSFFNILYYLYFIEMILVKHYEIYCGKIFNKIVLVSKKDIFKNKKKNIVLIQNGTRREKNLYKYKKNNRKILFIGNIKYLPNKYACYNFSKNILPIINKKEPKIEFHIVGQINIVDKLILSKNKNTFVHGTVNNLKPLIKNTICGLSNLKIATGFQNKILTYMSYGLPVVSSVESFNSSLFLKKNYNILVYRSDLDLINSIYTLQINNKIAQKISSNGFSTINNNLSWNISLSKYEKII